MPLSFLNNPALLLILACLLGGCSTNGQRIDRIAAASGLQRLIVAGEPHSVVVYEKQPDALRQSDGRLFVYLEGDGSPWGNSGMSPADDPTARNPLALRLMLKAPGPAIYVARPCYQQPDARCSADDWTSGRYSQRVVNAMSNAIGSEVRKLRATSLVLIGYSGGGPLAVLIAERLAPITAVITIAGNLDVSAWAAHHRYLPLLQSLNPATSDHAHPWPEFHITGTADTVVPVETTKDYFARYPAARRITIEKADHVCCWESAWPALLTQTLEAIK